MLTPQTGFSSRRSIFSGARHTAGVVALATAGLLSGCSTTPVASWNAPAERNISINPNGSIKYSPPNYPAYDPNRSTALTPGARAVIGAGGGLVLCRILGANWVFSTACAAIGGTIGYKTAPTQAQIVTVDQAQMTRMLEEAYRNYGKMDTLRGQNRISNRNITQYVWISETISRKDNSTEVQFTLRSVWPDGRATEYKGWALRAPNGAWSPLSI